MIDYLREILRGQYGASLAMLTDCIATCDEKHWEGKIANGSFRYVAYHTLFFPDLYLTPGEEAFQLRDDREIAQRELRGNRAIQLADVAERFTAPFDFSAGAGGVAFAFTGGDADFAVGIESCQQRFDGADLHAFVVGDLLWLMLTGQRPDPIAYTDWPFTLAGFR